MQNIITPKSVVSKNYDRKSGKEVWRENLRVAIFAADKIRSTLGPQGAYKMVSYNRGPEHVVKVTKDAIAILDELAIQYPPATIIAEAAKMQRSEAGDGVATFVVLLSALLRKADEMLNLKIHANTIIHGYGLAHDKALEIIDKQAAAYGLDGMDVLDVVDCKRNLLTSSLRSRIREAYGFSCLDGSFEKENIRFLRKPGGSINESTLIKGIVIKKEKAHPNMPDRLHNLRIAVATEKPGINRLELKMRGEGPTPLKLSAKSASEVAKYRGTEQFLKLAALDGLIELKVNVLFCEQLLESSVKDKLLLNGIFALEMVSKDDTLAVAKATGAKAVGQLKELSEDDLGIADELYTEQIGLEKIVAIQGCRGATFLLRGSLPQGIDELETAIRSGITVLKLTATDNRLLPGGGAAEAHMAQELKSYATSFRSKEQVAINAFSDALIEIPKCLAENYGFNPTDSILELKRYHADGLCNYGVVQQGCRETVCLEPAKMKRSVIRRAYEVSALILRIDEMIISKEIAKFHKK